LTLIDMAIALGVMSILAAIIMPNALQFARKRQVESAVRQSYVIQDAAKWFWVSHIGRKIMMGKHVFGSRNIANRPLPNLPGDIGEGLLAGLTVANGCVAMTDPWTSVTIPDRFCNARIRWGAYVEARDLMEADGVGYKDDALADGAFNRGNRDSFEWLNGTTFNVSEATGYWPGQLGRAECANNIDATLARQELAPYLGYDSNDLTPFTNPWQEMYDFTLDDCSSIAGCPANPQFENCWFTVSTNVPDVHSTTFKRYMPLGVCTNDDGDNACPGSPTGIPPGFTRCCSRIPWPGKETRFREWRPILQAMQQNYDQTVSAEGWYCSPWDTAKSKECED
jgi:hypothetical protein